MTLPDLLSAADRNGYTPTEYAEHYLVCASMERANAHLRRRFGTATDLRDAAICARLAGRYLARGQTLTIAACDLADA